MGDDGVGAVVTVGLLPSVQGARRLTPFGPRQQSRGYRDEIAVAFGLAHADEIVGKHADCFDAEPAAAEREAQMLWTPSRSSNDCLHRRINQHYESGPAAKKTCRTKLPRKVRRSLTKWLKSGDPDRNRTCDLQIRNLPLYPTELRDHAARHIAASDRFAKRRSAPNQSVSTMAVEA
jgi:hypothetical protein